jgi:kojibiose phosphorylase
MPARLFQNARPGKNWSVVQSRFSVKHNRHYEALFTIGSGYLNVRGSLPEGLTDDPQNVSFERAAGNVTLETFRAAKSKWGTYIPGFMDRHPALNEEMVNVPFPLGLQVYADGEKLDMEHSTVKNYRRWIDLRDGCLHRTLAWHTQSGAVVTVAFHTYAHLTRQQLLWQQLTVQAVKGIPRISVTAFLDGDVRTNGYDHIAGTNVWGDARGTMGIAAAVKNGGTVVECSRVSGMSRWRVKKGPKYISLAASKKMAAGSVLTVEKLTGISTSLDTDNPRREAAQVVSSAARAGGERLYTEHREAWDDIWRCCDVIISGDPETTRILRFSMFHLVRANPRNPRAAIDAKMNGGDAYWGRIHWDNEIFIAPFFIYTMPVWARPLLEYRYHTLAGARSRAKSLGYPGAMFAWESGTTGEEECPSFQYADHEVHITADVVLGLWHYACATNDVAFLERYAAEIIFEVARFWAARIDWLPSSEDAHILCVMGPDEYTHAANDNAYTNYLAFTSLSLAKTLYRASKKNRILARVAGKLGVTDKEVKQWSHCANALYIPYDDVRNLVLQSADFEDKAPIDFDALWLDWSRPFGQFVSQERLYRSRALKQADVLMLMQLFLTDFSEETVKTAYEYYEPYTTHDSSLSVSTHAILAARLGWDAKAWQYFVKARAIDLGKGTHNSAEGIHSANAGALWQCVIFGFLGLLPAYLTDTLTLAPRMPKHWERCTFRLCWHGAGVDIIVDREKTAVVPGEKMQICVNGTTKTCPAGRETVF